MVRLAEAEADAATSLYEFTSLVDKGFSLEEKKRIVELMWLVAFADAEKHPLEEHIIRRVAGLLNVPHPDFIDAKARARERAGGRGARPATTCGPRGRSDLDAPWALRPLRPVVAGRPGCPTA